MNFRLLAGIVPHGEGDTVASAASAAGAGGGTIVQAAGTAPNAVMQLLGLGAGAREVYFTIVAEDAEPRVRAVVAKVAEASRRSRFGVVFRTAVARFARFGLDEARGAGKSAEDAAKNENGNDAMHEQSETELVAFVVNKGFADDAMAAARKAGATGGTVLKARGTAKPGDETFFGVPLVPEKELLLVLAPRATAEAVFEAVRALPCFAERGSGIAFSVPVADFSALGG